ncbi:MAG: outer membrane lipoprotein LolB [Oxalobacter sp.]|nr:outer membrane lipoprotein LolB [Oxalobacter sp.]
MENAVFVQIKKSLSVLSRLVLCLSFILLAGCETGPAIEDEAELPARITRKCSDSMEISGRVSMNYTLSRNDKTESLHGKFSWKQHRDKAHIDIFSPLGQTLAVIDISPGQAIFTASGKIPVSATDADTLVFQQLGWPLPVSGMRHWLQGCATNTSGKAFQADPAHPEVTTPDGWRIHYVSWNSFQENQLVPRRIDMTHTPAADAAVSEIRIRLIIDEWLTENGKQD